MTRRERLEARMGRRLEWAEKAQARADARQEAAMSIVAGIPLGQPILVGHHSERRHRRALARSDQNMSRAVAESELAAHHASSARGIDRQLERSIFSDDPDAIEALREKISALSAERETYKAMNSYWRKHGSMVGCPGLSEDAAAKLDTEIPLRYSWERQPVPRYKLTNLGAEIRRAAKRIEEIESLQARHAQAGASGVLIEGGDYVRVTFGAKPDRETLEALRAAGFSWHCGSWLGRRASLPINLAEAQKQD